jgi:CheY-like chemotaxis protein
LADRPLRVLVADDNEANQALLTAILQAAGHEVQVVGDGAAALSELAAAPFDVVLMDIQMPIVDGLTAIATLRRAGHGTADMPVIAITANVFPEQVAGYIAAGAHDCIGKPFKAAEVLGKVARWGAPARVAA